MIGLLQRVTEASVVVGEETVANIGAGLLVLVGVSAGDTETEVERLLERILGFRIFPDVDGKMNLSLRNTGGGLLLVPQFTLAADTRKGTRPGFSHAAPPEVGERLFSRLCELAAEEWSPVAYGVFGADMKVRLVNDGPVTVWLEAPPALC